MKPYLIVIRGSPCSGKSTIAEELRKAFPKGKTAVIHTSIFYHEIVKGDIPEIAMENTKKILDTYLKNNYTVILEEILSFKDSYGKLYVNNVIRVAKRYKVPIKRFFFTASLQELEKRERKRRKISLRVLKKLYDTAMNSKGADEKVIDTTNKSILEVLKEVKKNL